MPKSIYMGWKHYSGDICGSSYQGQIHTTYEKLVLIFGPPHSEGDGEKVRAEWIIEFDDGTFATIYDWKDYDIEVEEVKDWHIGGYINNVDKVLAIIGS